MGGYVNRVDIETIRETIDLELLLGVEANLKAVLKDYQFGPHAKEHLESVKTALRTAIYGPSATPEQRHQIRSAIWEDVSEHAQQ